MLTRDIAQALGGRLDGDGAIEIGRLVHPTQAERPSDLALAMSKDAAAALAGSRAQAAVVFEKNPAPEGSFRALIAVEETRLALAKLTELFDPGPAHDRRIHPTAVIAADAVLGEGVSIGAYTVVGARSHIGAGTVVLPHVTIGADVALGANCQIHPGVCIGDRVSIGDRVIIQAHAVVGSDGFSYAPDLMSEKAFTPGIKLTRIHSLGTVEIGDDVEIGAHTAIDRATLETTRIGNGTKIDNHVHIGHNVSIGESCLICGKVGIAGSVTVGDRVRIGGGVGIGDHLQVGEQAIIGAGSGIGSNIEAGAFVWGTPALPHARAMEIFYYMCRLKRLNDKLTELGSRVGLLEKQGDEK